MLDFVKIATRPTKRGVVEIYPTFRLIRSNDLMIRGGDFYAVWVEDRGLWSTDEQDVLELIDRDLAKYAEENRDRIEGSIHVLYMQDANTGMIDQWHRYCQHQMRDSFHMLDEKLIFSNTETNKTDYASKRLPYPLEKGDISAYEKLISTLYSPEERHKIEWAIGSIVSGDSKKIQKFMVLYGAAGTGKSTILNIIQQLFEGYYSVFDAKALGSASNSFALEAFKSNPLVAIQHDGDLSKIEDNTRLNSLVSHELMTVNEKFKSTYANRFKCFLFMGTNKPVRITDAKSGLIRRLIDVTPSGKLLNGKEYRAAIKQVSFELGAIAQHCLDVYLDDPNAYDGYVPLSMMGSTNDFYNFVLDSYFTFKKNDGTTLKAAWEMFKTYCDEARVPYQYSQRLFKEELKNYFWTFKDRVEAPDGTLLRSYFEGFRVDKFEQYPTSKKEEPKEEKSWLDFEKQESIFDSEFSSCLAQYANSKETPLKPWEKVTTTLSDLNTSRLHYVSVPINHIVIDFDIPDENGNKCFEKNFEAAKKWPKTYAELSKSGAGIHLHYNYAGDPEKLSRVYDDHIEIKVFTGKSSLRRKLTKCNDLPITTISSGLPMKGEKMINWEGLKNEKILRTMIKRNLNKKYHGFTKPSVDYIYKLLEDAYSSDLKYDVTDMRNAIINFAANSSNNSSYCLDLVAKMHFKSEEISEDSVQEDAPIVFYDVEVFPNLFLVNWKLQGKDKPVVRMINPSPKEIEKLVQFKLIGFNCRRYDNHILYGCLIGYNNEQLYKLSQKIISGNSDAFFSEAYNISYTDVYDFCSKKQSLKKWEIELGIHHKELGLPWDQPVPEERWLEVSEYCDNDVIATEAVFDNRKGDFVARQILANLANSTVNDTTNSLSAKIIFGTNRKPQSQFNYRNMGEVTDKTSRVTITEDMTFYNEFGDEYTIFDENNRPIFPGYKYEFGKSTYRGEEVGEGGYVYSEPGMYWNVALLDIASMHPSSIIAEQLFGEIYTKRFQDIKDARIAIKHHDYEHAKQMLDGALTEYVEDLERGETWFSPDDLAQALKIVINSIYGLTAAKFDNPFRDPRNVDNIVAKRGALFMVNLKHEVQKRGFTVAHIKTDSIKIPNATPDIIQFVSDYGKMYGYTFEHEATYERMCLVNDAVYIAKYARADICERMYGYIPEKNQKKECQWDATGTQFQIPYVFKRCFSKDPIEFDDMCETKSVTSALYLDMNENLPDVSEKEKQLDKLIATAKKFGVTIDISGNSGDGELDPLVHEIAEGHNYIFIGKVGRFCPIKPGNGGGLLCREATDPKTKEKKYISATGAKGYRWMESEMVKELGKEDSIDRSYYDKLVDDAIDTISQYGDYEMFISDDTPPWEGPDDPWHDSTAFDVR